MRRPSAMDVESDVMVNEDESRGDAGRTHQSKGHRPMPSKRCELSKGRGKKDRSAVSSLLTFKALLPFTPPCCLLVVDGIRG